ncbi:MAG: hypothetical protein ABIW16_02655 [Sphingomicrobium sp.]
MKALILSAAVLAACAVPTAAVQASVFTLGGPLSVDCYRSAEARATTRSAFEVCDRSLSNEPLTAQDRAATLINRGVLHMIQGAYAAADRDYDAAAGLDPRLPDPWLNKAFIRIRQGAGSDAVPLLDKAIALGPRREALAYLARGMALEQAGRIPEAYADLRRAQQLEPKWWMPAKELARYEVRPR